LREKLGLVLFSGVLYSVTIANVGIAANYIPPVTLTALRLSTASAIFCGILCFLRPKYRWSHRGVADIVIIGVLNVGLPFLCLAIAIRYISTSLAAVLFNTLPVFTIVLAHFLLPDEKLGAIKILGTITAVAGAAILVVSNESGLEIGNHQGWIGQLLIIVASLSGALGVVYTRNQAHKESPVVLAAGQVFACTAIFVTLTLVVEGLPASSSYPWQSWAAMIGAAVSTPVIGFWLLFYMVNKYSASLAGFAGITSPLFSVIIGVVLLGEVITTPIAFGTLLLIAGVWSINYF
jgi:drug/metabolite transporter (DMT)-like permease